MARELSNRRRRWLTEELVQWQTDGVISPDQGRRILDGYVSPSEMGVRKRRLASFALVGLAVFMFGLAVLLLVGHNWQLVVAGWESLGQAVKVAIILAALGVSYAGACYLRLRTSWQRGSEVAFLWACLLFGAGIWLIAQVFHVDAHWPDGLWWWAIGVLPVALCLDTLLVHCLLVGLLGMWVGSEVLNFPHLGGFWGVLPNGAYSLLPIAALGLAWCYRKGSSWGVALYVGLIAWWIVALGIVWGRYYWHYEVLGLFFVAAAAPLLLIVSGWHRPGNPASRPWLVFGSLLTAGVLIPLGIGDVHRWRGYDWHNAWPLGGLCGIFALAVFALILASLPLWRRRTTETIGRVLERNWLPLGLCVSVVLMCSLDILGHGYANVYKAYGSTIVGNLAMLGFALWLMHLGLRDERGIVFASGVGYFIVWSIVCYSTLFGELFGMLGAAGMFFLCGLVLLVLSVFWHRRKERRHVG